MNTPIYTLSIWLAMGLTLMLLISAAWFCYRPYQPKYMRSFPLYCLVNCLSEMVAMRFPEQMGLIYNLFGCFELVYFAYFLTEITSAVRVKRLVWGLVLANVAFLLTYFIEKDGRQPNLLTLVVESIILSIPCFTYFHEIFLAKRVMNLVEEPSFSTNFLRHS